MQLTFRGGGNWERGLPFLVILVLSSCSSSATVSASCGDNLGGLASLWQSVTLSGHQLPNQACESGEKFLDLHSRSTNALGRV